MFALGKRTTFAGEKESCYQRLMVILQQYNLVLFDIDSSLPRRLDPTLLRVQFSLAPLSSQAEGTKHAAGEPKTGTSSSDNKKPGPSASADGTKDAQAGKGTKDAQAGEKRQKGSEPSGTSRQQNQNSREKRGAERTTGGRPSSPDPETLLYQRLSAERRKQIFQGPLFSQGLLRVVKDTSVYKRLLAEMQTINTSNVGVRMTDVNLLAWLEQVLKRQGSQINCRHGSKTLFDDLMAHCRFRYVADTQEQRKQGEQQKQERERHTREQQAEQKRREERAQQQAEERQRQEDAEQRKAQAKKEEELFEFERYFDVLAEAQLYLKVVRRVLGGSSNVASSNRTGKFYVRFTGTSATETKVQEHYSLTFNDLEQAAKMIRLEAVRARDEAIQRANADYKTQCETAFQVAVNQYKA